VALYNQPLFCAALPLRRAPFDPRKDHPMRTVLILLFVLAGTHFSAQAQDAARGESKAAMCIGCHGIVGYQASFPQIHKVPMISGQGAKYIVNALTAYKKGERKHPTMRGIAGSLSDQDMADLAAYYEKHGADSVKTIADAPVPAPSAEVAALLTKGACVSCHGANYSKPIDGAYPKIAGQHGDYLYVALNAYSTKGNPQMGRGNAIMGAQVAQFKPEELKAMAKYIGSLPGELRTVPQSKFR
jgi:cytochrome c553